MNRKFGVMLMGLAAVAGCKTAPPTIEHVTPATSHHEQIAPPSSQSAAVDSDVVVAKVGKDVITRRQLEQPLVEAYGLNILLNLVQLDLAKQNAAEKQITVSPEEVAAELATTESRLFKDAKPEDYDTLLTQFLQQQKLTRPEFNLVMETNAYLRKIARPQLQDKVSDDMVREQFNRNYGETILVRHIQLTNATEIGEAQRRLAAGESFQQVARDMSRNPRTAALDGEVPRFSRVATDIPQAFKDVAFSLTKPGEVSAPVQDGSAWHLIQLVQRFEPRAIKFEDVKDSVKADLIEQVEDSAINQLRRGMAQQALLAMEITDPILKAQFEARMAKQEGQATNRDELRKQLERLRQNAATQPTTAPATQPVAPAATIPAADERPPATMPGAATPVAPGPTSSVSI